MIYLIIPIIVFFIVGGLAVLVNRLASSHQAEGKNSEPVQNGCLFVLANLLLRPVPVIFAFYQLSFAAAVVVALAMWLISRCFDLYKGKLWTSAASKLFAMPLCAGLTLLTGNVMYFQLIPSGICVILAVEQLTGLVRTKQPLFSDGGQTPFTEDETKLARWGLLGASLVGLLISEFFRQSLSLSSWIWYYGYLRLELLPIILGSMAPAMMKMIRRSESEPPKP